MGTVECTLCAEEARGDVVVVFYSTLQNPLMWAWVHGMKISVLCTINDSINRTSIREGSFDLASSRPLCCLNF